MPKTLKLKTFVKIRSLTASKKQQDIENTIGFILANSRNNVFVRSSTDTDAYVLIFFQRNKQYTIYFEVRDTGHAVYSIWINDPSYLPNSWRNTQYPDLKEFTQLQIWRILDFFDKKLLEGEVSFSITSATCGIAGILMILSVPSHAASEDHAPWRDKVSCLNREHHALEEYDFDNGQLHTLRCQQDGVGDGPFSSWHSNGQVKVHGDLKNDLANGKWTYWYRSGEIRAEGTCLNGKTASNWIIYPQMPTSKKSRLTKAEEQIKYCQVTQDYFPFFGELNEESTVYQNEKNELNWLAFRFEPLFVMQSSGGFSSSFGLYYSPKINLSSEFNLGVKVGAFPLYDVNAQNHFWVIDPAVFAGVKLYKSLWAEGGAGIQYWSGRVNTGPSVLINLGLVSPSNWKIIKLFYLGIGIFGNKTNPAIEGRSGVEVRF